MLTYVLLTCAAFASGVMNAIAGGGAFMTCPALVFAGVPPVAADASSTVALFPGQATSAWAYRHDITAVGEPDGHRHWRPYRGALLELQVRVAAQAAMFAASHAWLASAGMAEACGRAHEEALNVEGGMDWSLDREKPLGPADWNRCISGALSHHLM